MICHRGHLTQGPLLFLLILSHVLECVAKGIAVIGAAGGGNEVCAECGGNYTEKDMEIALLILGLIMCVFVVILCCQCYSRVMWEFSDDQDILPRNHYKSMPPPAYVRNSG